MNKQKIILLGYSGHGFAACDIILSQGSTVVGYCDPLESKRNPYGLKYLGSETDEGILTLIKQNDFFTSIGNNIIRHRLNAEVFSNTMRKPTTIVHHSAQISSTATIGSGVMVGGGCFINALSKVEDGAICNTCCVIEHECAVGSYSHIAPGAILCGGVSVGAFSFIGARSVVREGITIGENVMIGAGSVIIRDIPDNSRVVGNPQRII